MNEQAEVMAAYAARDQEFRTSLVEFKQALSILRDNVLIHPFGQFLEISLSGLFALLCLTLKFCDFLIEPLELLTHHVEPMQALVDFTPEPLATLRLEVW